MIVQGRLLTKAGDQPLPGWIAVDRDRIVEIGEGVPPENPVAGDDQTVICAGFIDAHLHLPQHESIGCDGLELLDWLDRVIYPAESAWSNPAVAEAMTRRACEHLLRCGTLGFAAFLTSHAHASPSARAVITVTGQRAIAGQVLMDRNGPDTLLGHAWERPEAPAPRFEASVNPRFAIACTDGLLAEAARLSAGAFVQTHLAESLAEVRAVAELFPDDASYTAVYDRHGLLTPRTLLAHCVHLSDDEWALIARRNSIVVHCPSANTFLSSGMFDLAAARRHGVRLALGTDVAAGPDHAMPRVARAMIEVAKLRRMTCDGDTIVPTPEEAWTMITAGNADALGWTDAGRLEVGAAADLLLLRLPFEMDEHGIGRLIYTWRDDYIHRRIVGGRLR